MDYKLFLAPLASAGFQVAMTVLVLLIAIILSYRNPTGAKIMDGILKEKDHEGEYKFSMSRFLLFLLILVYIAVIIAFRDAAYLPNTVNGKTGFIMDDANFLPFIDNIEGYLYKTIDFLLGVIFGTKLISGVVGGFGTKVTPP